MTLRFAAGGRKTEMIKNKLHILYFPMYKGPSRIRDPLQI